MKKLLLAAPVLALIACVPDAQIASENLSKAADMFSSPMEPERSMTIANERGVLLNDSVCGAESLIKSCRFFSTVS